MDTETQHVGVELLANREEVAQERRADLSSEKTGGLKKAGKGKRIDRAADSAGVDDETGMEGARPFDQNDAARYGL